MGAATGISPDDQNHLPPSLKNNNIAPEAAAVPGDNQQQPNAEEEKKELEGEVAEPESPFVFDNGIEVDER